MSPNMKEIRPDWMQMVIHANATVLEAVKVLDRIAGEAVLVLDEDMKLLGTVTDGDIRRALLRHVPLDDSVTRVMNQKPQKVTHSVSRHDAFIFMRRHVLRQLPIVNEENRVVGVHTLSMMLDIPSRDNVVIIMAGGLGSRLGDLTKDVPKPMLPVGDKPLLEHLIQQFSEQGFHRFVLTLNYKAEVIESYFGDGAKFNVSIEYIREPKRMGTAGSLSLLQELPMDPFIVINGDILTKMKFTDLLDKHESNQALATMAVREYSYQIPYGVVKTSSENEIVSLEEKPIQSYYINAGIYCLDPTVLEWIPKDQYFDMTMLFESLQAHQKKVSSYPVQEYWLDIGKQEDFLKAKHDIKKINF